MKEKSTKDNVINLIWISIGLVVLLVWIARPLIMQEDAYRKVEGTIVTSRMGNDHYRITLRAGGTVYRANRSKSDVLGEKAVVGKEATIWYHISRGGRSNPGRRYFIVKMIVDDEVIIPFNRALGVRVFFIGIILAFLIALVFRLAKRARSGEINVENNR